MFRIPQIVLLAAILAGLTHAQTSPKESPADWAVDSDAQRVAVIDKLNSRKNLTRVIRVDYHVASTDRRQDQMMALFLGAPNEDAAQIDAVVYRGLVYGKPLRMQYFIVEFYAGDRLIAKRESGRVKDVYNVKGTRIYEQALAQYQKEKAGR
jgi:hypothetical protein